MAYRSRRGGTPTRPVGKGSKFMETARDRRRRADESDKKQTQREYEDIQFYNDDQWPEDIRRIRLGKAEGNMPATPARPCLTINKVKAPVLRVMNQERASDLGVEIVPADDFEELIGPIDDKEIELREGLTRRIQRTSDAQDARSWAFQRAVIAGRGYYRVLTRYMPGKTFQQEVATARIFNQGSVRLDPSHEQPDGSDADWGFIGAWIPWERYLATWPTVEDEDGKQHANPLKDYDNDDDFRSLSVEHKDWFKVERGPDGTLIKNVYITEYIYCDYKSRTLLEMPDGTALWADEAPEGAEKEAIDSRVVPERLFTHCIIDGCNILEKTDWPIPYVGIVKVLGEEIQLYDEERRAIGIVRPARGAQEGFNAMISKMVEVVAYAPIPPIMVAEGQDEGFQQEYQAAMTRTLPALHYRQTDLAGQPAPPPMSVPRQAPIEPIGFALQMFSQSIQDTTATHDTALGKTEANVTSARHAKLLTDESGMSTAGFLDNLARSVRYEGLIINALLYPVYGRRPGRLAHMLMGDGERQSVLIGVPFTTDPRTKRPMPVRPGEQAMLPPGMPPGMPPGVPPGVPPGPPQAPQVQEFKLTENARFNVAIKVSKTYDTRREQEHQAVGQVLAADPTLMQVIGDLFFKSMDGPGHKEMAKRMEVMLAPPIQELLAAKKEGRDPMPPQVQQQLEQAKQMVEQLSQALQQAMQQIQTDQVKQHAENERAKMDANTKAYVEQVQASADVEKAKIQAVTQVTLQRLKMAQENLSREDTQAHETGLAGADAAQERHNLEIQAEMQAAQAQLDAQLSESQSEFDADLQAGQSELEAGLQAQQSTLDAALEPPPEAAAQP